MEAIRSLVTQSLNMIWNIGLSDTVDILIVAYLIYRGILFLRRTNSYNLTKGILLLLLIAVFARVLDLKMISYLLSRALELGVIALVILFQPELRRALERLGSGFFKGRGEISGEMETAVAQTVLACRDLSNSRTGALIIFERNMLLNDVMSTGTIINADATAELIKNIFFNKAPLHDGALILREGRLASAGCVLPLSGNTNLSKELGTRHRAGIGLSEQSDAVVVIVSEETGTISVAIDGMLKRHLSASSLEKLLRKELIQEDEKPERGVVAAVKKIFKGKQNEEDTAAKETDGK